MARNNNPVFDQVEAMCLMTYECEKCKTRERIWNSRPRVSPFTCSCAKCDGFMRHVDWQDDFFAPNHIPQPGDRIFVDWIPEAEREMRKKQIDKSWDSGQFPMCERTDLWSNKEEALEYFMAQMEGRLSIITLLHEFAHCIGKGQREPGG